jgi:hypothetical protein
MGMFGEYRHRPSEDQKTALRAIQSTLTAMLMEQAGRRYYLSSLDPGVGKTTAIVSWMKTYMETHQGDYPHGILICVDRHIEIDRYVTDCSLPVDSFAVLAGKDEARLNSLGLGADNVSKALVLFTTKEQVRRKSKGISVDAQDVFKFNGKPRAVKVWDESLSIGKDIVIPVYDLGRLYTPLATVSDELVALVRNTMDDIVKSEESLFLMPEFPELPYDFFGKMRKCTDRDLLDLIWKLSGQPVTIRRERGKHLIIDCVQSIPNDFPPCIVLDASGRIKGTYEIQKNRLKNLEHLPYSNKSYRNLTISVWDRPAGRGITKDLKTIAPELAKVINGRQGEPFLFLLYQDQVEPLKESLARQLPPEDMWRLKYCTWGRHTATNEFCNIPNVVALSAYQYPDSSYDAITRAAGLLTTEGGVFPTQAEINRVKRGEISSEFLQGVTRSMARKSEGDTCPPCRLWLIAHPKTGLRKELPVIFPDSVVQDWQTQEFTLTKKQQIVFDLIQEQLRAGLKFFPCAPIRHQMEMQPTPFKKMLSNDSLKAALGSVKLHVVTTASGYYFQVLS